MEKHWREIACWILLGFAVIALFAGQLFMAIMWLVFTGLMVVIADNNEREIRKGIKDLEDLANKREGKDSGN
jgi:hypothetical protein